MGRTLYVDDDTVRGELRALARTHVCEVAEVPPPPPPTPPRTGIEWTIFETDRFINANFRLWRNTANPQDPDCINRFVLSFDVGFNPPMERRYQTIGDVIVELKRGYFDTRVFDPALHTDQPFRMPLAACAGRRVVSLPKTDHELLTDIICALHLRIDNLQNKHTLKVVYTGQYNDKGQYHGNGKLVDDDGTIYEGQWENGKIHGKGTETHPSRLHWYQGDFLNGKRHGQGEEIYLNGKRFTGTWHEGEKKGIGHGKEIYADRSTFEGEFMDGQKHNGTRLYPDGSYYVGGWKDNKQYGTGRAYKLKQNHQTYTGDMLDGKKHGQGMTIFDTTDQENDLYDGQQYDGAWCKDEMHGKGKYVWKEGDSYEGDFVHGKFHGKGTYTHANGDIYRGDWENDEQHGEGVLTFKTGDVFTGQYVNGQRNGLGTFKSVDGSEYTGTYEHNLRNGHGIMTFPDGRTEIQDWHHGNLVL